MKSLNPSFHSTRRALLAAAVVLTTGAAFAQSSSGSSSSSSPGSSSNRDTNYNSSSRSSTSPRSSDSNMGTSTSSAQSGQHSDHTGSASGQYGSSTSAQTGTASTKLSWTDKRFVTKAADSGQAEVQLAQLAAQKATNPDVRQFAQMLVDQHTQVNSELMNLASSKNVKIDQEDNTKDRTYRRLSSASGNEFDREFVEHMVDEHEKDVKMFEKAANNAKDPQIRQFASNTLQHLRQHLTQVQQLQRSIVPTGRDDDDSSGRSSTSSSSDSSQSGSNWNSSSSGSGSNANPSSGSSSDSTRTPSSTTQRQP